MVDGHLGVCTFSVVVSNAARDIHVLVFAWICFQFSWFALRVELLMFNKDNTGRLAQPFI